MVDGRTLNKRGNPKGPLAERLWAKVDKNGAGGCWLWTGHIKPNGYAQIRSAGQSSPQLLVHRAAYEQTKGPIPEGLQLDHLCRVRHCVNPDHLEPVTGTENNRRRIAALTHCKNGHPFDEENTRWLKGVYRVCRTCQRANLARYRARKRHCNPELQETK